MQVKQQAQADESEATVGAIGPPSIYQSPDLETFYKDWSAWRVELVLDPMWDTFLQAEEGATYVNKCTSYTDLRTDHSHIWTHSHTHTLLKSYAVSHSTSPFVLAACGYLIPISLY